MRTHPPPLFTRLRFRISLVIICWELGVNRRPGRPQRSATLSWDMTKTLIFFCSAPSKPIFSRNSNRSRNKNMWRLLVFQLPKKFLEIFHNSCPVFSNIFLFFVPKWSTLVEGKNERWWNLIFKESSHSWKKQKLKSKTPEFRYLQREWTWPGLISASVPDQASTNTNTISQVYRKERQGNYIWNTSYHTQCTTQLQMDQENQFHKKIFQPFVSPRKGRRSICLTLGSIPSLHALSMASLLWRIF